MRWLKTFTVVIYKAHHAVIFAMAQLSCMNSLDPPWFSSAVVLIERIVDSQHGLTRCLCIETEQLSSVENRTNNSAALVVFVMWELS